MRNCIKAMVVLLVICLASTVTLFAKDKHATLPAGVYFLDFEDVSVGGLPAGWKIEATGRQSPLATWQVQEDKSAPSGTKVLALSKTNHNSGGTFNLCWTDGISFKDGEIEVSFKAVKGRIDQGGGIIWRVQNRNNYYVARFNPLEDNFRIYYVRDGIRRMIESARVSLQPGKWHTMKITQQGSDYECYLDGHKLLEGNDSHFKQPGGVGLWTKADAVTSFDNFKVVGAN